MSVVHTEFDKVRNVLTATWTLDDLMLINDKVIISEAFGHDDVKWKLYCYPRNVQEREEYISILLDLVSSTRCGVDFEISIKKFEDEHSQQFKWNFEPNYKLRAYGAERFLTRTNLRKYILKDNSVQITIRIQYREFESSEHRLKMKGFEKRSKDFKNWSSDKFADVTLRAEGKTIKAHKYVLASSCEQFKKLIEADVTENRARIIDIPLIEFEVLKGLLDFVYTSWIKLEDVTFASKLMIVADRFGIVLLKQMCEEYIVTTMDKDSMVSVVMATEVLESEPILRAAVKILMDSGAKDIKDMKELRVGSRFLITTVEQFASSLADAYKLKY